MHRRTVVCGSAAAAASFFLPLDPLQVRPRSGLPPLSTAAPAWPPGAREYVQAQQERRYRKLGVQLGWGDDPATIYGRLTRPSMPRDYAATEKLRGDVGAEPYLTAKQWTEFDRLVSTSYSRYASIEPQTAYEDPNRYRSMVMTFDQLRQAQGGATNGARPLLATLASGEVNALICEEPQSGAPILFFEDGLFAYFYQFALIAAWALPPLSIEQLSSDRALALLPGRHTIPPQASRLMLACLGEYTIRGTLKAMPPTPLPASNVFTAMSLLVQMERFAMAHELSHLEIGHLSHPYKDRDEAWEQEFAADTGAVAMMTTVDAGTTPSQAFPIWACDLALTAMHLLDRALAVMAFGRTDVAWVSETHPDALSRRTRLRERVLAARGPSDTARTAVAGLYRMNDAILGKLWELAGSMLLMGRGLQGDRPSPLWRSRIAAVFADRA